MRDPGVSSYTGKVPDHFIFWAKELAMKLRAILPIHVLIYVLIYIFSGFAYADGPLPESTPNGILTDRVLPLAHMEQLDGSEITPIVGLDRWRQTMHELRRSAEVDLNWPAARHVQSRALMAAGSLEVDLALIHARYDRMQGDNVTSSEVLALGALRESIYYGAEIEFRLDPERIFTHRTRDIAHMTFDAGDGKGTRPLTPGQMQKVSYTQPGVKTLTLVTTLDDGRVLKARTAVDVKRLTTPDPTATWSITATEPYENAVASGSAYLYLAPGHTELTNPVVVVEGFDLDNSMNWPVLYDLLNQQNLLEDLRAAGYDAVVLDFTEATEPIQRNAFVLTELLTQVNAAIDPGTTTALIGASMGGLVSRYALLWMEAQAIDHRVRTYLSFDSPHRGANIPLGLQHWLSFFNVESEEAAYLLSRLNTSAAKQMLLYHHQSTNGTTANADVQRGDWLDDLANQGDWPIGPRLVAVANGSGAGLDQGFSAGGQIISYEYRSLLVDIDGDVWAVPDGGPASTILDAGINLIWPLPDTYQTVGVGGTLPWDSAPGGHRGSMAQMDETTAPYGDIIALHDNHCFIPTVSALALDGVGPFHDIDGDENLMSLTAFDQVYFPTTDPDNQGHIALTAENKVWFLDEIQADLSATPDDTQVVGATTRLHSAVPNPFNPSTSIAYSLGQAGWVDLSVFDIRGRLVSELFAGVQSVGEYSARWNGRDKEDRGMSAGVYFVRLKTDVGRETMRVTLVK